MANPTEWWNKNMKQVDCCNLVWLAEKEDKQKHVCSLAIIATFPHVNCLCNSFWAKQYFQIITSYCPMGLILWSTVVISHIGYSTTENQQGFLRGFNPGQLKLNYGSDIECLITLVKVWLFIMCENEIPKAPFTSASAHNQKDHTEWVTRFMKQCFYPNLT